MRLSAGRFFLNEIICVIRGDVFCFDADCLPGTRTFITHPHPAIN